MCTHGVIMELHQVPYHQFKKKDFISSFQTSEQKKNILEMISKHRAQGVIFLCVIQD